MAIPTNGLQLVRLAGAVFNQQLSATPYSEILTANKSVAELNAWANSATAAEFKGKTTTDISKAVLANLGLTQPGLEAWLAGQLTAGGGVAKAGETMLGLLNDFSNMTSDVTFGSFATTFNTKAAASQALSLTAGTATGTYAAVSSVVVNTALTLTSAVQTSTGTTGDDTFTAAAGTWGTGDVVNGGTGTDTLNATITGTAPTQSATSLVSVEVLNLTASPNTATLDLTGVTGVTQINNVSSANGASLSVSGVGTPVNSTLRGATGSTTITYGTAVTAATALTDASTLTLAGTSAGSSYTAAGIELVTVNSTVSANTMSTLTTANATAVTIGGDQSLTIGGNVGGATLATLNAAGFTGAALTVSAGAGVTTTSAVTGGVTVTAPTAATTVSTITTQGNSDRITLGAGNATVSAGAGNDTINSGAGVNTITPGAGNDTINLNAGTDTIRFNETGAADADVINGWSNDVIALNLGTVTAAATTTASATTLAPSVFGTVQTGGTSPVLSNVNGVGTGTAIAFQAVLPNATATTNTVVGTNNVLALNGAYTDGTANGAITALGTTATTGITTSAAGKFLLVTYSVGNIAQIWSYAGDTTVNTDIDVAELSLVATLNGVALGSLTAANFATFLGAPTTTVAGGVATGQTIAINKQLSQVTSTANSDGQFFTGAADTVTVATGLLPNAAATATAGLTLLDDAVGDGDVLNVTVLTAAALNTPGFFTNNIETINMNMLVGGGSLAANTNTPGTTTFGATGAGAVTVTGLPAAPTIALGANRSDSFTATMTTAGAFNVTMNGVGTAATTATGNPTTASLSSNGTTAAVTLTGSNFFAAQAGSLFGAPASAVTFGGTGTVAISGAAAAFGAQVGGVTTTFTGGVTLRPTDAGGFDLSGTGADTSAFTGVRAVDLTQAPGAASYVLAAPTTAGATFPVTFSSASATAIGALSITQAGSGTADALTVTQSNASANVGAITTPGIETLTINLGGTAGTTATKTLGAVTMDATAATQALTITSNAAATTSGAVTADSLNTTGVVGTFTGSFTGGIASAVFTGSTTQPSFFTTSQNNDIVTTGSGNDAIYNPAGGTGIVNLNGGLGNDTYQFTGTNANGSIITDTGGIDNLVMGGAGLNISAVSSGATLASMGIDRVYVNGANALTVATGQIGAQTLNNINGGGATAAITLSTVGGTLNVSGLTLTQVTTDLPLSATGAALAAPAAITALTLTATTGAETITSGSVAATINALGGIDTITLGSGNAVSDTVRINSAAAVDRDLITNFLAGTGGDVININSGGIGTLTGTNNFASAAAIGTVAAVGNTVLAAATEVMVITAATIADATSANSLDGTNLLAALAGTITANANNDIFLIAIGITGGGTAIYSASTPGNTAVLAAEISLIGVLNGVTVGNLTFNNFANGA